MSARFDPGEAWGFVGESLIALVAVDATDALVEQLGALALRASVSPHELVDALSRAGIGSLPSLAAVLRDAEGFHIFVRGSGQLTVVVDGGVDRLAVPRAASWSEEFRASADGFSIDLAGAPDGDSRHAATAYWCDRGVVGAARIEVDAEHFQARSGLTTPPKFATPPADEAAIPAEQPATPAPIPIGAHESEGDADALLSTTYLRRLIEQTRDREPTSPGIPAVATPSDVAYWPEESGAVVNHTQSFEESDLRSHIRESEPPAESDLQPDSSETPVARSSPLISSVPGTAANGSVAGQIPVLEPEIPAAVFEPLGDHDGHTVIVETLRASTTALGATQGQSPTVQAVHCPEIHPNPPHASQCRSCGAAITDHTITIITRPVLGELRFENGDAYPIDRPMLFGRRPATARDTMIGGETARLVTLSDPQNVLSKVHLEVRIEEWQVLVVDRNSTNHTIVTLPERPPTQLRPGDPVQILPGTEIELGGATRGRYEIDV